MGRVPFPDTAPPGRPHGRPARLREDRIVASRLLIVVALLSGTTTAAPATTWLARYDGPAHGEDRPCGMVADSAGNCWLAGFSFGDTTDFDFATVRFDADGRIAWARRYGTPNKCEDRIWTLARDSAGNIVGAGGTIADFAAGWDFQTVKYSPDGDSLWLKRFGFPFEGDDKPVALAVGPGNTLYVAGFARRRPDSLGARTDQDIALLKYSPDGDTLWTRLHAGRANLDDGAVALAVDAGGNCYVAGKAVNAGPGADIVLLKYRPDGTAAWQRFVDGPARSVDLPTTVLLGQGGRIYLVGTVTGKGTSFDYFTACYDTNGNPAWQQTFDGAGKVDVATAACLDPAGNLVVTGQSTGTGTSLDIATVKYSPDGELLWSQRHNGTGNGADRGTCIAAGDSGGVVVGGTTAGRTGFADLVLLGYSAAGDMLWSLHHSGTGAGETRPVALDFGRETSGAERLLVAGCEYNADTGFDFMLMRLDLPR